MIPSYPGRFFTDFLFSSLVSFVFFLFFFLCFFCFMLLFEKRYTYIYSDIHLTIRAGE